MDYRTANAERHLLARPVRIGMRAIAGLLTAVALHAVAQVQAGQNPSPAQAPEQPIISDKDFNAALPPVDGDLNAPLAPLPPVVSQPPAAAPPAATAVAQPPAAPLPPDLAQPLPSLQAFAAEPLAAPQKGTAAVAVAEVRYETVLEGLKPIGLEDQFEALSTLKAGKGKAETVAQVAARAAEDGKLAVRLMRSLGYYDGSVTTHIEQNPPNSLKLRAVVTATPGTLYKLGAIHIDSTPTRPPGLIEQALPLKRGDPIDASRIESAEANVGLSLSQQGYPFLQIGQRDIALDAMTFTGDYTLPVTTGPRSLFGGFQLAASTRPAADGKAATGTKAATDSRPRKRKPRFDIDHIELLARFERGDLYDSRKVNDLRQALVATGLFSSVAVQPKRTDTPGPDGTEYVDLTVIQNPGPLHTLAGEAGYSTGQGIRVEGSWTNRNLFPPEGALILNAVLGTQEQGAGVTFRRSNAGERDRTFMVQASVDHADYDAYEAFTGSLSARFSRDSTPLWQKHWTYYYGAELIATNEDYWNYAADARDRGTWMIAALPLFLGYDASDNLLNPTRGYRVKLNLSPETSVRGPIRPYLRSMLEGTAYYPVMDRLVIAGRVRAGSIVGTDLADVPPSRRYYSGGGGSVRGFGYQQLGPESPDGKPDGGRSFNEFSLEARYRFGNFGIVPFIDAGQVYDSVLPQMTDIRFGAGIGGRFYTNFGPLRLDIATPIDRHPGESVIALYISIGQAF